MEQIFISDAAQAHFRKLLDTQEEGTNIRIFVVNPGTPGAECGVSYCPPNSVEALSLIHISEPTRHVTLSRMPSSA